MNESRSLQEQYGPDSVCYGCGPANPRGLHIRSFPDGDEVVADFQPEPHHHAFDNVLNGGIIGTLLDCHCNWTAAHHLMGRRGASRPPTTVTALDRPSCTPMCPPCVWPDRTRSAQPRGSAVKPLGS